MWKFDFYYSFRFWLSFAVILVIFRFLFFKPQWRRISLLIVSLLFLAALPQFHLYDLLVLLATTLLSYAVARGLCRGDRDVSPRKRKWLAASGILAVLSVLAFFKYRFLQEFLLTRVLSVERAPGDLIFLLGVSYFSFRMLHTIIESYKLKIRHLSFLNYVNYIVFFPSYISGPINRFDHFAQQLVDDGPKIFGDDLRSGAERIVHGLFKKFVIVQILLPHIQTIGGDAGSISQLPLHQILWGLYAYALYFYFDFSAYSDLAIGCGRILGVGLPENFNNPFLQRNIRELWANWHMSLTQWLIDYIYWPLVRRFRNLDYFRRHPLSLSVVAMILTFLACGMWHGEKMHFVLWGAYHGIGISVATVYQRIKSKTRLAFLRKYFASGYSRAVGAIMTFNFFSLGLSLFVGDLDTFNVVLSKVFAFL